VVIISESGFTGFEDKEDIIYENNPGNLEIL
jgi:hypothetical protein